MGEAVRVYRVNGMSCEGCARSVTNALRKQRADAFVQVDLDAGLVSVGGIDNEDAIGQAIERAGFEFRGAVAG